MRSQRCWSHTDTHTGAQHFLFITSRPFLFLSSFRYPATRSIPSHRAFKLLVQTNPSPSTLSPPAPAPDSSHTRRSTTKTLLPAASAWVLCVLAQMPTSVHLIVFQSLLIEVCNGARMCYPIWLSVSHCSVTSRAVSRSCRIRRRTRPHKQSQQYHYRPGCQMRLSNTTATGRERIRIMDSGYDASKGMYRRL